MFVGQTPGVSRQVCWLVKELRLVGRCVGWSNSWGRSAGMLVGQTAAKGRLVGRKASVGRQVCWLVKQQG